MQAIIFTFEKCEDTTHEMNTTIFASKCFTFSCTLTKVKGSIHLEYNGIPHWKHARPKPESLILLYSLYSYTLIHKARSRSIEKWASILHFSANYLSLKMKTFSHNYMLVSLALDCLSCHLQLQLWNFIKDWIAYYFHNVACTWLDLPGDWWLAGSSVGDSLTWTALYWAIESISFLGSCRELDEDDWYDGDGWNVE